MRVLILFFLFIFNCNAQWSFEHYYSVVKDGDGAIDVLTGVTLNDVLVESTKTFNRASICAPNVYRSVTNFDVNGDFIANTVDSIPGFSTIQITVAPPPPGQKFAGIATIDEINTLKFYADSDSLMQDLFTLFSEGQCVSIKANGLYIYWAATSNTFGMAQVPARLTFVP